MDKKKPFAPFKPAIRISFGLVMLTVSILLVGDLLGFIPDASKAELEARKNISESFAIQFSALAVDKDQNTIRKILSQIVKRNNEILSAGLRNSTGMLLFQVGKHKSLWGDYKSSQSNTTHVIIPIFRGKTNWGSIELRFKPLSSEGFMGSFHASHYQLILYVFIAGFFGYLFILLRTLRQIDPSAVVPGRVNAAFDTLAEGVLIIDEHAQIVLANKAFAEKIDRSASALLGLKSSELNWKFPSTDTIVQEFPWDIALETGEHSVGDTLLYTVASGFTLRFIVNCAPIIDGQQKKQGVLITFDDVTELEERNDELQSMVSQLEDSQAEVKQQNKELHYLATRDPLTNCLNRRSFNEQFEVAFNNAKVNGEDLPCIMADIDHFKVVNDNFGHAVGDAVIIFLADILHANTRKDDLVGRYGGEEFCIVLPGQSVDEAVSIAERIRLLIKDGSEKTFTEGPKITASLGVASIFDNAKNPGELNNQADQALYVAKESGRNRVIKWKADYEILEDSDVLVSEEDQQSLVIIENELAIDPISSSVEEVSRLQIKIEHLENIASKLSEELQLNHNYDSLTGLPNQALFSDRINQAIQRGQRHNYLAAVLTVEIDLFNQINNSVGRSGGDILLKRLATRLTSILRKTDGITLLSSEAEDLTISRLGADEFGILFTDLKSKETATWLVKRLFDAMQKPVDIEGNKIFITCNVGASLYPDDAETPEGLISHAMIAKFHAKNMSGQNNFQFYDTEMHELSIKQMHLETELRQAVKNEEWLLYFQPQLDIATGRIKGVEALIRWNHPERGILSPFEFIEFAEKRGFIIAAGEWVLRQACKQGKHWLDLGFDKMLVAVNLSAVQLRQKNLADIILEILDETNLPPRNLELEVTETSLMDNFDIAIQTLKRLHSRGIKISIDDFGTGYSSLNYLKHLPVNTLKIDRSFIQDIIKDEYDKNIVNTIITMAHGMNLKVIAEGVETQQQFDLLSDLRCDEIQGYLLSRPIPASEITELIQKSKKIISIQHSELNCFSI